MGGQLLYRHSREKVESVSFFLIESEILVLWARSEMIGYAENQELECWSNGVLECWLNTGLRSMDRVLVPIAIGSFCFANVKKKNWAYG